jgi:excinuclease ABC subunit B
MGIATWHEVMPDRPGGKGKRPRGPHLPDLDSMGPGIESVPARDKTGPRSTMGKPGDRGGWKAKKFRK